MKKGTAKFLVAGGAKVGLWTIGGPRVDDMWPCTCACGTERAVITASLREGRSLSCGCAQRECMRRYGENASEMPEYKVWHAMLERCYDRKNRSYPRYGGRGIRVCKRWRPRRRGDGIDAFLAFVDDMGRRPSVDHSIDRKDSNGDYRKRNCAWVTEVVQQNNRTNNHMLTHCGRTMTLAQWCRELRLSEKTVGWRLRANWTVERALFTPIDTPRTKRVR